MLESLKAGKSHAKEEEDLKRDNFRYLTIIAAIASENDGKNRANYHNSVGFDILLPDTAQHSNNGDNHEPGEEPELTFRFPQLEQAHNSRLIGRIRRKYKLHPPAEPAK